MNIENHPVTIAIAPLKIDAVRNAEKHARAYVEIVNAKLAEHDYDFTKAYPTPDFRKANYKFLKHVRDEASSIVKDMGRASYLPNAPRIVIMDAERIERFVKVQIEMTAASFEAFALKLTHKIGECDAASLDVNGTWGYSIIRVTKGSTVERWKTQQIVNRSSLGMWFNQWPTRKVK